MSRLRTQGTVNDESGKDRLRLVLITRSEDGAESEGLDFDSLVWERWSKGGWEEHLRITESQFESDTDRGRWPSELHSFDASTGTAVIRVAEGDAPLGSGQISYVYSWRRWDLNTNFEKDFFYSCKPGELFDPFDPNRSEDGGDDQSPTR